jgi:hypothetical protein
MGKDPRLLAFTWIIWGQSRTSTFKIHNDLAVIRTGFHLDTIETVPSVPAYLAMGSAIRLLCGFYLRFLRCIHEENENRPKSWNAYILTFCIPFLPCRNMKLFLQQKLKLIHERQSLGQSVLVSGTHLGPATNFSFSLKFPSDSCVFVIL